LLVVDVVEYTAAAVADVVEIGFKAAVETVDGSLVVTEVNFEDVEISGLCTVGFCVVLLNEAPGKFIAESASSINPGVDLEVDLNIGLNVDVDVDLVVALDLDVVALDGVKKLGP